MFESLTQGLTRITAQLAGRGRLTEHEVDASLREVRVALLEADVALSVVTDLLARAPVRPRQRR